MKKLIISVTALMLFVILFPDARGELKAPDIIYQSKVNPNEVFSLSRNGEVVSIQWHVDLSTLRSIHVMRNTTGTRQQARDLVGLLEGKDRNFNDIVPSAGAFWYWLKIMPHKGNPINIGPLRAAPDEGNTGTYPNYAEIYKFQVERTETKARFSWDIPSENLKMFTVTRATNPLENGKGKIDVIKSREWKHTAEDAFLDPNVDYWYRTEVKLNNGAVLNFGPYKAEFKND